MGRMFRRAMAVCSIIAVLITAPFLTSTATAIGIIVPREPDLAAPRLQKLEATAEIINHVARTRITHEYRNPNSRPMEADFYFPVPRGADITDFVLYMNGKPVKGEVLDKETAKETYRTIVRKLRDPGLVEWADRNLFRVRIFPVPANGTQKLEIEVTQPLTADQGYFRYTLPLSKPGMHGKAAAIDAKAKIKIQAEAPVRNVYSPTHDITTGNTNGRTISVKADALLSDAQSLVLYYETTGEDVAASLLTHRIDKTQGYFSLRISPPWDASTTVPASHGSKYVFVVDTSGSMADGNKIIQAQKALNYCVNLLKENDQFNLIRFSTTVEPYQDELLPATEANRNAAVDWINSLEARGGTNIADALQKALSQNPSSQTSATSDSIFTIVFITDGLPTVGETATDAIIKSVEEKSKGNVRIFSFGVGHDVNTRLLDTIADETRAASDYVEPQADLEVPISRFFDKVNRPALFNLELQIPDAGVSEVYPPRLPDLFYGTELAVYGKYSNATTSPITLSGTIAGEAREFKFEKSFPAENSNNQFIEKLWATRKVAWLLDQIRKSGENDELRQEVEELARKYSIVTPYTSYLAIEDEIPGHQAAGAPVASAPARPSHYARSSDRSVPSANQDSNFPAAAPAMDLMRESGSIAVNTARRLQVLKSADTVLPESATAPALRQTVNGKTFMAVDGVWKDTEITGNEENHVKIEYLSDAWFQVMEKFPQLKDYFSLGDRILVRLGSRTLLEVSSHGIDSVDVRTSAILQQALADKK